jgi:hypothetical protein
MGFLTFNFNKNLNYAIHYWALEISFRFFTYLKPDFLKLANEDSNNEYIYLILLIISDLISGFFALYIKCTTKRKRSSENKSVAQHYNIDIIVQRKRKSAPKSSLYWFRIIFICLLDYLCRSGFFIFFMLNPTATYDNISHKVQTDMINHFDIMLRFFFSTILLNMNLSRHHSLAAIVVSIVFLILLVDDLISLEYYSPNIDKILTLKYVIIFLIRAILFPLEDTIIKILFNEDYIIPQNFMFFRGVGELILLIITIIPILCKYGWKINFKSIFINDLTKIIAISIIYTWSSFIKAHELLNVIYYYSSQSVSFLIISESISYSIVEIIKSNEKGNIIILVVEIICIIFSTFATLIYDEIIVIKKWGLDKDVATEIVKRAELEINAIGLLSSDNDDEEEESEGKNNNSLASSVYI